MRLASRDHGQIRPGAGSSASVRRVGLLLSLAPRAVRASYGLVPHINCQLAIQAIGALAGNHHASRAKQPVRQQVVIGLVLRLGTFKQLGILARSRRFVPDCVAGEGHAIALSD